MVVSSFTNFSSISGVVIARGRNVVSPVKVVVVCSFDSSISVGHLLEKLRNGTGSFPV